MSHRTVSHIWRTAQVFVVAAALAACAAAPTAPTAPGSPALPVSTPTFDQPATTPTATTPPTTTPSRPSASSVASAAPTSVPTASPPAATAAATPSPTAVASARPYDVFVPDAYDGTQAVPLLVLLHWYGGTGDVVEAEYQLEPLAQEQNFLYVRPDATIDSQGERSWNATDACCHWPPDVDDSAYLAAVIDEVEAEYNVDPGRVFLFGISNGGFMAYRMACDHAGQVAAIVSIVGATFNDRTECTPSEPVSILEIHGTADELVPYDGGAFVPGRPFPGSEQTVTDWAVLDGCEGPRTATGQRLDLESTLPGRETIPSSFEGCPSGIAVELWTVRDGSHTLHITPDFVPAALDFLFAHPKP